jgi:predicted site-specific integrase-resolvase
MVNFTSLSESPEKDAFLSEIQILPHLDVSRRTLAKWRARGLIPYVRLPGSRRILYDWASVRSALLRQQSGTN